MTTRQKRHLSDIKWLVLHHTAANDPYSTHETLDAHLQQTNLGYHATVDDDAVFKAKAAGSDGKFTFKEHVPLTEVVWGAAGCNFNGAHLSVDGNSELTPPTKDEIHAVIQIFATWAKRLGWRKRDVAKIVSHKFVGLNISATKYVTACPGRHWIELMPYIRDRVSTYLPD